MCYMFLCEIVVKKMGQNVIFEKKKKKERITIFDFCANWMWKFLLHIFVECLQILKISLWMTYWSKPEDPTMIIRCTRFHCIIWL